MEREFIKTQDYIDISYMIDHIDDYELRVEMIEKLGYLVTSLKTENNSVKVISKHGKKIKMQITPKIGLIGIARFVIMSTTPT